jgi:1,2-diacylglycerol 3-alpha-glucosyltransferase
MRILMISDVYFPRVNGVSTSIQIFRQTLKRLGHEVTLIAPEYPEPYNDDQDVLRIPSRYLFLDKEDRIIRTRYIWDRLKMFESGFYDIIHIQTPFMAHTVGVKLARKLNIPCVESYHTYFEEYLYHYLPIVPKPVIRSFTRLLSKYQCNQVDSLIVPSSAMNDALRQYGVKTSISIIPTGINLAKFDKGDGKHFRSIHNIPETRPTIVHVGRIAHEKNIDFLLKVLKRTKQSIPDVLLILAGEGPALNHLKKLVVELELIDNVLFIGYLDREKELLDCYCAGDAFIFASRTETQGLVLLEAMALGVPVVSTAVMGTRDILAPHKGALVAKDDVNDFSAKVVTMLTKPGLRKQLGWDAKMYASRWSQERFAKTLAEYYKTVIEDHTLNNFKFIAIKENE